MKPSSFLIHEIRSALNTSLSLLEVIEAGGKHPGALSSSIHLLTTDAAQMSNELTRSFEEARRELSS